MNYLNPFFTKGLIEFGEILDKKKCDEIYNKIVNSRNLSKNIFRSKKEYFKNSNPRKTNPGKGFNNLAEKFDLAFVENHPTIKKNLGLLLGKDYETVMKNFVTLTNTSIASYCYMIPNNTSFSNFYVFPNNRIRPNFYIF